MTSGRVPAAAADMISCGNWPSSTPTRFTLTPDSFSKAAMVFFVASTRSVRFSRLQTVILLSGFPLSCAAQPDITPIPTTAAKPLASALDRRDHMRINRPHRQPCVTYALHQSTTFAC